MKFCSKTITSWFIIALIVAQYQVNCFLAILTLVGSIIGITYSIYGTLNDAHDTYNKFATASTQDVMDTVVDISNKLDKIATNLDKKLDNTLNTLLRRLPLANKIDENVQELNQYITRIDSLYRDFNALSHDPDAFSTREIGSLIEASLSSEAGDVKDVIDKMHSLIVPGRIGTLKKSLLLLLAEESRETGLELCDTGAPPQERLFELYSIIMMTEIRAYALTGYGHLEDTKDKPDKFEKIMARLQKNFDTRVKQYLLALKEAMSIAFLQFRRCDPPKGHVRGETFVEFERFIQAFIVQETAINPEHYCSAHCGFWGMTKVYPGCNGFECYGTPSTCYGSLSQCYREGNTALCEMEPTDARRYQFVNGNGDKNTKCRGTMYWPQEYTYWLNNCEVCKCICIEDDYRSKSSHYVNLRPQVSDIENNKIVTGIRFRAVEKILNIQIQECLLQANATLADDQTKWQELETIVYDEASSVNNKKFIFKKDGNELPSDDIGVLDAIHKRFYLDDLTIPDDHVVTGVKFARLTEGDDYKWPFYLMIRYTAFDYETGKLINLEDSKWISFEDMPYTIDGEYRERYELEFNNPLKAGKTDLDSRPNQYIDTDLSSWYEDASQTYLPLWDALPLYGNPLEPLTGLGLFHKGSNGNGGFFTLVAKGFNRAPYIVAE